MKDTLMPPMPIHGKIYGTATLNEKGQLVIPADARTALNLTQGEKLLIMSAPFGHDALIIVKTKVVEEQMKRYTDTINQANSDQENQL